MMAELPHRATIDSCQTNEVLGRLGAAKCFPENGVIRRLGVQECEVSKGGKLQCVSDCFCAFCYTEIKGHASSQREGCVFTRMLMRSKLQLGM